MSDFRVTKQYKLIPTPDGYRKMLRFILLTSTDEQSRAWAIDELLRVRDVEAWSK